MTIDLEVLRSAMNRLIDYAQERGAGSSVVADDLYWFIPQNELYVPDRAPATLSLGALQDDWEELSAIASGEKEPVGYALVWASSVLRKLGDSIA